MTSLLGYHVSVRHSIPASVALFALIALPVVLVSSSHAQINGTPSSATASSGMGGHTATAPAHSFAPLAPNVVAPRTGPVIPRTGVVPQPSILNHGGAHGHRRRHDNAVLGYYPYAYPVLVPYAADANQSDSDAEAEDDSDYQGGPTIFDRRGSGADSYVPPVKDVPAPRSDQNADADPPAQESPQPLTVLVFKDGKKLEVGNYAIVGATLYDLTLGHHRKVMLADLDLDATQKLNDEQGIIFQLPPSSQAN
jgi:hypothetical protein